MSNQERPLTLEELEDLSEEQLAELGVRVTDVRVLKKILTPEEGRRTPAVQRLIEIAAETGTVMMRLGDYAKVLDIVEKEEKMAARHRAQPITSLDAAVRARMTMPVWYRVEAEVLIDLDGGMKVGHFTVVPYPGRKA